MARELYPLVLAELQHEMADALHVFIAFYMWCCLLSVPRGQGACLILYRCNLHVCDTCDVLQEGGVDLFHAKRLRNFPHNYCLLWDKVLRLLAREELLFDDFELIDKLTRLVTALNM
jgi:hypothetical protein